MGEGEQLAVGRERIGISKRPAMDEVASRRSDPSGRIDRIQTGSASLPPENVI
jgi:hypothetical protein